MAERKKYPAILLLLGLVTVPFLLVAGLIFQDRLVAQSNFQRMIGDIQVFRAGLSVAPPLQEARDLAPAVMRLHPRALGQRFQAARADTDARLDAFFQAVAASAIPSLLGQADELRREWRELAIDRGVINDDAVGSFESVERINERLYHTLAAVLYMGETTTGTRPRPNDVLSLPLNGLRQLTLDVGRIRSIATFTVLRGGFISSSNASHLHAARARLAEQIKRVDNQIMVLASRVGGFALRQRWRPLRETLNEYLAWVDREVIATQRMTVTWTQAMDEGGARLEGIHALADSVTGLAINLVDQARRQCIWNTGWIMAGITVLYLAVLGLSLLFFQITFRAIRGHAEVRAKSQFLARMSHEIRTPLNGVLGLAELLRETNPSPRQQEYIGLIENAGRTLNTLVNDVLDYAKLEAGKLELEPDSFDPSAMLIDCAHMLSLPASDNGDLVLVDVESTLPAEVLGDAPRLRQVLTNLLSNAIKFTRHGWIRVSARCLHQNEQRACLEFRVTDNGIGMTRDEQRRLFQHFSQANATVAQRFGGTGLGLSISQELVRLMGGEIHLRSAPGQGADFRFTIWLPVVADAVPMSGRASEPALVWDRIGNLRDLLADDPRFDAVTVVTDPESLRKALNRSVPHLLVNGVGDGALLDQVLADARQRGFSTRPVLLCGMRERGELAMRDDLTLVRRAVLTVTELQQLLSDSGPGQVPLLAHREPARDQNGLRVLVAEDNPVNQMVSQGYLERLGVVGTVLSDDGQQALEAFEEGAGRYRLVLMDLDMPVMDGFKSAAGMRALEREKGWPPAIILALSAHVMPEYAGRIREAGMNGQLIKPLTLSALQTALQEYLTP